MRILRIQVDEMASPILALERDGAVYDVAALEERWGWGGWSSTSDFHARVFSMRCAGLSEVDARLVSGDRPSGARLWPRDFLPLPPCDTDRAAYVQLAPRSLGRAEPGYSQRDARSLVGTEQPVAVPEGVLGLELGVAALVAEQLDRATPTEAASAILGFSLFADWTHHRERWLRPMLEGDAPSQLGPCIGLGIPAGRLAGLEGEIVVGERRQAVKVGPWRFQPGEALAFLSARQPLRPGDVVALEAFAAPPISRGERFQLTLPALGTLAGWAAPAPEPLEWRLQPQK